MIAAATDDDGQLRAVDLVLVMLRTASEKTRREVHKLLAADLDGPPAAVEIRLATLGFLASLLIGEPERGCEFRDCERDEYDRLRPDSAPSSRRLVDIYGSWSRVCRAAYGLRADGTTEGPGKPWPTGNRGKGERNDYTREEVIAAVKLCAKELRASGLVSPPTSWQYDEWVRRHKLAAKTTGKKLRLPYANNVYRRVPKRLPGTTRWQMVLELAGVNERGR